MGRLGEPTLPSFAFWAAAWAGAEKLLLLRFFTPLAKSRRARRSRPTFIGFLKSSLGWGGEVTALAHSHADGEVTARPAVTPYRVCGPLLRSGLYTYVSFIIQNLEFNIFSRAATSRPTGLKSLKV